MAGPKIQYRGSSEQFPLPPNTKHHPYPALPPTTLYIVNATTPEHIVIPPPVVKNGKTFISILPAPAVLIPIVPQE